jgi:hypothetical protein
LIPAFPPANLEDSTPSQSPPGFFTPTRQTWQPEHAIDDARIHGRLPASEPNANGIRPDAQTPRIKLPLNPADEMRVLESRSAREEMLASIRARAYVFHAFSLEGVHRMRLQEDLL